MGRTGKNRDDWKNTCHSRGGGNLSLSGKEIPAFAGMTREKWGGLGKIGMTGKTPVIPAEAGISPSRQKEPGLRPTCHSRGGGNLSLSGKEIPAFAGMTREKWGGLGKIGMTGKTPVIPAEAGISPSRQKEPGLRRENISNCSLILRAPGLVKPSPP